MQCARRIYDVKKDSVSFGFFDIVAFPPAPDARGIKGNWRLISRHVVLSGGAKPQVSDLQLQQLNQGLL